MHLSHVPHLCYLLFLHCLLSWFLSIDQVENQSPPSPMPVNLIPGEFTSFSVAIAILSGFIIFFGYISMFLKERLFLSEAFVAVIVGIIAGPLVTNGIDPYSWRENDEITKQLARCIIAVQVIIYLYR
ncbi:hypothetical protein BDF14DRAFT_429595 [Spinellus fusiger]|nr:hypothetical protein BDF14DRAFT_429595 [Spinellus fusiger]